MRIALTRTSILTFGAGVAATLGLAACSTAQLVPFERRAPAFTAALSAAAKPCRQPGAAIYFGGTCDRVMLERPSAKASLATYRGIAAMLKLYPRKDVRSDTRISIFDATGQGDIKPRAGNGLPPYSASGKPILYFKFVNPSGTVDFVTSPYVNIDDAAKLRGSSCTIAYLATDRWHSTKLRVPIFASHVVRFLPLGTQFNLPHGASYFVVACK
jgi:hypothetical protein